MKTIALFLFLLILPMFVFTPSIYAAERVYPDSVSKYNFKRLGEKALLLLNFTSSRKIKYMGKLLEERLLELEYVAETKNIAHIEKTSQRYETTAGQLTELIVTKLSRSDAGKVKDRFEKHKEILKFSQSQYKQDSSEWRFIQNDINSLKIYSDKLSF